METPESAKAKGNECMAKKDFNGAVMWYGKGLELDPKSHVLYSNRSAAYLSQNMAQQALEDAEMCVKLNPTWAKGYSRKGAALQTLGKLEGAKKAFEEGIKNCGEDPMLRKGLSGVEEKMKMGSIVAGMIMNTVFSSPQYAHLRSDPVFLRKVEAVRVSPDPFSEAMKDQQMMEIIMENAQSAMGSQDVPGGAGWQPESTPAPEPKPEPKSEPKPELSETEQQVKTLKEEGNALYKQKSFEAALEKYRAALALDPNNIQLHNNVSAVLLEEGKFAESVANSQQAIELARQVHAPFEDVAKVGVASECDVGVSPHRQRGAEARQLRRGAGGV